MLKDTILSRLIALKYFLILEIPHRFLKHYTHLSALWMCSAYTDSKLHLSRKLLFVSSNTHLFTTLICFGCLKIVTAPTWSSCSYGTYIQYIMRSQLTFKRSRVQTVFVFNNNYLGIFCDLVFNTKSKYSSILRQWKQLFHTCIF